MQLTICFTGHRPQKLGGYTNGNPMQMEVKAFLRKHICRVVEKYESATFITGGAIGVDTWAAQIVIEMKQQFPHVKLIIAAPCSEHYRKWPSSSQNEFFSTSSMADELVVVSSGSYDLLGAKCMQTRNIWMVGHSDAVLAVWDKSNGGTANCVRYAQRIGLPIIAYNPATKLEYTC